MKQLCKGLAPKLMEISGLLRFPAGTAGELALPRALVHGV